MAREESRVEEQKRASDHLRGGLAETLADGAAGGFARPDTVALKFHGVYQQENRDSRQAARQAGQKAISFMVRVAIPGGRVGPDQYLALDRLADEHADGSLRITTRQGIQFHGVLKGNLKSTIARINASLLTTLSACGDIPRNVMAAPAPFAAPAYRTVQRLARELAAVLRPGTGAYHEIWLDGERVATGPEEPFYGETYLPRKFKLGVTVQGDNAIDIYAYDAGLIGLTDAAGEIVGYNLVVGGGMGMTHDKPDTFARIASPVAFVPSAAALAAVRAVVALYRDHGNRGDRRHARIKYLLDEWGLERFRETLGEYFGAALTPPRATPPATQVDYLGRHDQGDGRAFVGVWIPAGRIRDTEGTPYRTALRAIVSELRPTVIFTPLQSVLLADLDPAGVARLEVLLAAHGLPAVGQLGPVTRHALACPALPTCGLAITEAERVYPELVARLEAVFTALGIDDQPLTVRMTGCPNGCARPYNADIGLVGKRPGAYHVYVGGGLGGERLADLFAEHVPFDELVDVLRPLLERYRTQRVRGERLGDFYQRIAAPAAARTKLTGSEAPSRARLELQVLP